MRKLILLLMLSGSVLSMQAQSSLRKQVEDGIKTSISLTEEHEWREAFATCHALDVAIGKGNPDWNFSAPHGAGRIMSRTRARDVIEMEDYRKAMEGIYTTSVNPSTLDEAPMAYKSLEDIIDVIEESVDVIEVLKPVFNYKAS